MPGNRSRGMTMANHIALHDLQRTLYRAAERQGADVVDIFGAAPELRRAAFRLNSINESECNGVERWNPKIRMMESQWNDSDQARADRLRAKAETRIKAALVLAFGENWGQFFTLEFNGDPRGAPVYLHSATDQARHLVAIW
ncbi:hypothetical protein RCSALEM_91 [Rhodobacter phage RcSalem]|nr:hypothetical protein RCSALEM_91 [Rhodobacter phage RcSalem]